MANPEQVAGLKKSVGTWNFWRSTAPEVLPDLKDADLSGIDLKDAVLSRADLRDAILSRADLRDADLRGADLRGADLSHANLRLTDLRRVDFSGANLTNADFTNANLNGANLRGSNLSSARLQGTDLRNVVHSADTVWPEGFNPPSMSPPKNAVESGSSTWNVLGVSEQEPSWDFSISFHPDLSPQQVKAALEILADYFRSCGGAGIKIIDLELETISIREPEYAGR